MRKTVASRDVVDYLEIPIRHWRLALPVAVLVMGLSVAMYLVVPREYQSRTLILIESQPIPPSMEPRGPMKAPTRRINTLREEILSRTRLERVIEELNPYPVARKHRPLIQVVNHMRKYIKIQTVGQDAFALSFRHASPEMTRDVTNLLAEIFIAEVDHAHEKQIVDARLFIEKTLNESREQIDQLESSLSAYKHENLGALPEQLNTNLNTLQRLQLEQQALAVSLGAALDRKTLIETNLSAGPGPSLDEVDELHAELAMMRGRYTDSHPDVKRVRTRIERLASVKKEDDPEDPVVAPRDQALRDQLDTLELDIATLRQKSADLEIRIAKLQANVEKTPKIEQGLASLTRDYARLRSNYTMLLQKKIDAQMEEKLARTWQTDRFNVIDPAHLPGIPAKPILWLYLGGGLVLALTAGIGVCFVADFLDHSIHSPRQAEVVLSLPVLLTVPHLAATPGGAQKASTGGLKARLLRRNR